MLYSNRSKTSEPRTVTTKVNNYEFSGIPDLVNQKSHQQAMARQYHFQKMRDKKPNFSVPTKKMPQAFSKPYSPLTTDYSEYPNLR